MNQWETLSAALGHASETEMWRDLYLKRKMSIGTLSVRLACSPYTIRTRLCTCQIPLRGRGGPNSTKIVLTEEVLESVRKIGVPATAKNLKVTAQALYGRLYYAQGLRKRDLERAVPEPGAPTGEAELNGTVEPQGQHNDVPDTDRSNEDPKKN